MSRFALVSCLVLGAAAVAAGCSDQGDPFANVGDASIGAHHDAAAPPTDATTPPTPDAGGDPTLRCTPVPTRVAVLGDSITDCTVVGGPNSANCVSKKVFDYVKGNYAPNAAYLNVAVGGAQTAALEQQIQDVPGGPGHVLVLVYMGGNDLSPYIFQSDQAAKDAYDRILPGIVQNWLDMFAYFEDRTRFPDGVTVIMNNQYNPFDDCTARPYFLSAVKINLLHMFNQVLRDIANQKFQDTIIIDQFTPFLGHGHHYNVDTCPYYQPGMEGYMADLIHANPKGNVLLAEQIYKGVDQLYKDCP